MTVVYQILYGSNSVWKIYKLFAVPAFPKNWHLAYYQAQRRSTWATAPTVSANPHRLLPDSWLGTATPSTRLMWALATWHDMPWYSDVFITNPYHGLKVFINITHKWHKWLGSTWMENVPCETSEVCKTWGLVKVEFFHPVLHPVIAAV